MLFVFAAWIVLKDLCQICVFKYAELHFSSLTFTQELHLVNQQLLSLSLYLKRILNAIH
jgi:hypothetical protein